MQKKRKKYESESLIFKKKQKRHSDDYKEKKLKKEIKIEDTEYIEFKSIEMYPDLKKVKLKIMQEYQEVTIHGEGSNVVKESKLFDIKTMIKENAAN